MKLNIGKIVWPGLLLAVFCGAMEIQAQPTDYSPYVQVVTNRPNLLGYWRFDPVFQTNSYVNGFTGTNITNAFIGGPGTGCPLIDDPANQGLLLTNGAGYLQTDLVGLITNQFTLMAWINIGSYPGTGTNDAYYEIIDQQAFADDCDLIVFPTGQIYFYTDTGGSVNTPNPVPANEWHFIAGTMTNGGPRNLYLDGQLVAANTAATHHVSTSAVYIGYGPVFVPRRFVGSIDEAAVFNRALSSSEIVAIYLASGPTNIGTLQSISLNISAKMLVGTQQAAVIAMFSSGTNFDVTGLASYASSDTNVLTLSSNGLVTALKLGTATVTATFEGMVSTQTIAVIAPIGVLTHRYSFSNGNANDSVGTANGTLRGTATFSGGALALDGNGYVSLPAGTIDSNYYALSIEMWANVQRTPDGQTNVISAFGNPTGAYVRLGTHNSGGPGNAWIGQNNGFGSEVTGFQPGPVTGNVHLAAVWNPVAGQMEFYQNGYPVNGNKITVSLGSISSSRDVTNVIGANIDGADGSVASIQEYRVYYGPLTLEQIRTSIAAGPANAPLVNGQISAGTITNVTVTTYPNFIVGTIQDPVVRAGSATVQNIDLTTLSNVTFTSGNTNVLVVLTNNQVQAVGVGTATLTATYLGASGQTTVTTMASPSLLLTHRYSFVSDARDSVAGENGTLMGNAAASAGLNLNQEGDGNGYGDYLSLPRDLMGGYPALTVEAWVNLGNQVATFPRIWSSGSWSYGGGADTSAMLLSPDYPGPSLTLIISPQNGIVGNDQMNLPADAFGSSIALQGAGLVQVVAVLDPANQQIGALYYNGQLAGVSQFTYPLSQVDVEHCLIGKSGHVNDPFLVGTINELRVYYGAMTAGQVASNYFAVTNAGANTAIVGVNQGAARISDQPLPQTVLAGAPAIFTVGALGAPPLSFQWLIGTHPIPGATAATYVIPSAGDGNAGTYSVQVSNSLSLGSPAVSTGVLLAVDPSVDLTNGLLLYLPFDGNYTDASGNGNDGAPGGSPAFIPGKVGGGAIHVNTVAGGKIYNYVSVPNSTAFSYAGDFSVAFWQRHTGLPNDLPMVGNAVNSTYQPGWVFTDDLGRLDVTLVGGGSLIIDPSPSPIINDGQWHHLAMVVNREIEQVALFVDGSGVFAEPLASLGDSLLGDVTDTANNVLTIGSDPTGTYGVSGEYDIDELALWSRALSSGDVLAAYTLGQAGQNIASGYVPETLAALQTPNGCQINWSSGILQSAPTVLGPWAAVPGATAPSYQFTPLSPTNQFFRVMHNGGGILP